MLEIIGKNIRLTRGDSAALKLDIVRETSDGQKTEYDMAAGDVIVMSARRQCDPGTVLRIESRGKPELILKPEDTQNLHPEDYVYDVQITTTAGDVYTVIDDGRLTLTRGVSE